MKKSIPPPIRHNSTIATTIINKIHQLNSEGSVGFTGSTGSEGNTVVIFASLGVYPNLNSLPSFVEKEVNIKIYVSLANSVPFFVNIYDSVSADNEAVSSKRGLYAGTSDDSNK